MPKFGLIGYPIEDSLSPLLFRAAYGGRMRYDLIENSDFDSAWSSFAGGYDAVNVTAPFKELACRRADILSDECRRIGAANILVRSKEGVKAFNSDYLGLRLLLCDLSVAPGGMALVVGYGGAGKAAAAAASSLGIVPVICNRTVSKADGLRPLSDIPALAGNADVLIYTLPCPILEMNGVYCPIIVDANYRRSFLGDTADYDRYVSGREWLFRQALTGYEIMTGEVPDVAEMISALR